MRGMPECPRQHGGKSGRAIAPPAFTNLTLGVFEQATAFCSAFQHLVRRNWNRLTVGERLACHSFFATPLWLLALLRGVDSIGLHGPPNYPAPNAPCSWKVLQCCQFPPEVLMPHTWQTVVWKVLLKQCKKQQTNHRIHETPAGTFLSKRQAG